MTEGYKPAPCSVAAAPSITALARGIIMDRNADKKAGVERLNNFPKATEPTQRLG